MTIPKLKIAKLDEASLQKLRQLEEATGTLIVALEREYPLAELEQAQLAQLQQLEKELDVILIAYQTG